MEPVTHFLTGACLGRAGFNRRTAYATLAMTLAAEAPDIDVVSSFGGPVTGFCHHRGITHTFLGAPFMALAVTGIVWCVAKLLLRLVRRPPVQPVRWGWVWLLALLADFSHLLLDYTNNYGLRPFFPFDAHWHAWSIVFIFDPVLFALLVLGLAVPALLGLVEGEMRRRPRGALRGRGWAIAALTGVLLLYALRNAEHAHAIEMATQAGSTTREPLLRVAAEPSMADPFTWHTLAETKDDYQAATAETLDDRLTPGGTVAKPPVTPSVAAAKASYLGRVYESWSSWPVTEDIGPMPPYGATTALPAGAHTVVFRDLRFAPDALGALAQGTAAGGALRAFAVVDSGGNVISEWMNGEQQRPGR